MDLTWLSSALAPLLGGTLSQPWVVVPALAVVFTMAAYASARAAPEADQDVVNLSQTHPFYGQGPQAGIHTPQQRHALRECAPGPLIFDFAHLL